MKRLIALAFTVCALAAVPVAFGDDGGSTPADGSTPATATQNAPGQAANGREQLRLRIQAVEARFAKHCGSTASGTPQRCTDVATRIEARLTKLDTNVQARIAKIQATCSSTSTDSTSTVPKCKNAADRVTALQAIDTRVQALAQKVQDWLDGKTVTGSTTTTTDDSSLDQAAAGLGKLTKQAGANG
jgi:hypothetical protein